MGNAQGGNTAFTTPSSALRILWYAGRQANFSFFRSLQAFRLPAAHAVELHRFRERQLLRMRARLMSGFCAPAREVLPLRLRQWARFAVCARRMWLSFCSSESIQRIGGFCARGSSGSNVQRPPFFPPGCSVGAVAAGPSSTNVAQTNGKVFCLQLRVAHCSPLHAGVEQDGGSSATISRRRWKVIVSLLRL